ncbi:unnamed protein product [Closterium sp. NIES-64]|nr:unnamed protein product [Closterium sp. NIES-64]
MSLLERCRPPSSLTNVDRSHPALPSSPFVRIPPPFPRAAQTSRRRVAAASAARASAAAETSAVPPAWPGRAEAPASPHDWAEPKAISLIGSTGSIGTQTLDIVAEHPDRFKIVALAAGSNIALLAQQVCTHGAAGACHNRCMAQQVRGTAGACHNRCMAQQVHATTGAWHNRCVAQQVHATTGAWHNRCMAQQVRGTTGAWHNRCVAHQVHGTTGVRHNRCVAQQVRSATDAWRNRCMAQQVRQFQPSLVSVQNPALVGELKEALAGMERMPEIVAGDSGIVEVARHPDAETVVTGIVGCAGLKPTVAAIEAGKDIALANKETLIAGGPYVLPLAKKHGCHILPADSEHSAIFQKKHGCHILPADSEHSAIFQCIQGLPEGGLRRIILTASGGAFRDWPVEKLKEGLEVIEAHYLFGADYDNIDIVIHPQSIIHSMVETQDSSVLAQLGWPDMRLPILYTLSWPDRVPTSEVTWPRLDFIKMGDLTFREPNRDKYPSMDLSYAAGRAGGTMTGVLSAANEQAVEMFLDDKIHYLDICRVIEGTCDRHRNDLVLAPSLEDIVHFDQWARVYAAEVASKLSTRRVGGRLPYGSSHAAMSYGAPFVATSAPKPEPTARQAPSAERSRGDGLRRPARVARRARMPGGRAQQGGGLLCGCCAWFGALCARLRPSRKANWPYALVSVVFVALVASEQIAPLLPSTARGRGEARAGGGAEEEAVSGPLTRIAEATGVHRRLLVQAGGTMEGLQAAVAAVEAEMATMRTKMSDLAVSELACALCLSLFSCPVASLLPHPSLRPSLSASCPLSLPALPYSLSLPLFPLLSSHACIPGTTSWQQSRQVAREAGNVATEQVAKEAGNLRAVLQGEGHWATANLTRHVCTTIHMILSHGTVGPITLAPRASAGPLVLHRFLQVHFQLCKFLLTPHPHISLYLSLPTCSTGVSSPLSHLLSSIPPTPLFLVRPHPPPVPALHSALSPRPLCRALSRPPGTAAACPSAAPRARLSPGRATRVRAAPSQIQKYTDVDARALCPDDWFFVQELVFLIPASHPFAPPLVWQGYASTTVSTIPILSSRVGRRGIAVGAAAVRPLPFPQSLFDQAALADGGVGAGRGRRHGQLRSAHGTARGDGDDDSHELRDRVGAACGLPYFEAIAMRGLIPLFLPHKARLPFYDNTLDVIHSVNSVKYMPVPMPVPILVGPDCVSVPSHPPPGEAAILRHTLDVIHSVNSVNVNSVKYMPVMEFEELVFEWDRVLRPGGLMWFEMFYAPVDDMVLYVAMLQQLRYRRLHWTLMFPLHPPLPTPSFSPGGLMWFEMFYAPVDDMVLYAGRAAAAALPPPALDAHAQARPRGDRGSPIVSQLCY